jgi:uncharacterized protein YbjT (DUF2867 family)
MSNVLVTGANGFIGSALAPALQRAGHRVVRGARGAHPGCVLCDLDDDTSVRAALQDIDIAVYLVHGLKSGAGYATWEKGAAQRFARACAEGGVKRIVYLGGVLPHDVVSEHLRARADTGVALGSTHVPVVELRASMIIGARSESWRMTRDLAARLPVLVSPPWFRVRQQPVALDDMLVALCAAVSLPNDVVTAHHGIFEVPGPEIMSGEDIVLRTAALFGVVPRVLRVPTLPKSWAAALAPVLTRANKDVARELLLGLGTDLLATGPSIWDVVTHTCLTFEQGAARALLQDHALPLATDVLERVWRRVWRTALRGDA